jgi:hypothetical protein
MQFVRTGLKNGVTWKLLISPLFLVSFLLSPALLASCSGNAEKENNMNLNVSTMPSIDGTAPKTMKTATFALG